MAQMKQIMNDIRHNYPTVICGKQVVRFNDYLTSLSYDLVGGMEDVIHLPKSNVLSFFLAGGANLIIRPSGTEPKIKVYALVAGPDLSGAEALAVHCAESLRDMLMQI
jgi:phosphomannomutase